LLRAKVEDVPERVRILLEEKRQLERQLADAKRAAALGGSTTGSGAAGNGTAGGGVKEIGGVKLMARTLRGVSAKDLRGVIDDGKKQLGSGVVAIVGIGEDGKASIAVGVTSDLASKLSAVDLVKAGAEAVGGKGGGGRPDMAQAGGPDGARAAEAIIAIEHLLEARSGA
jgi:alanyl-tRNA synthetase